MYNEKQKLAFMDEQIKSNGTRNLCENVFNGFQKYEEEWGADLCTKTAEELKPVVEQLVGFRVVSKGTRIILLRKYVKWCVANGIPGAIDGMSDVDVLGLSKMKSMTVFSPASLQAYLDILYEPESERTIDNIYRCFYWLAFSGMDEEDILTVKTSDVDFENMVVRFNNNEYIIYREAIPAIKNCVNLSEFIYKHPNYPKPISRFRVDGDRLLRGIKSNASVMFMRTTLSRKSKKTVEEGKTEIKLSHYRAWLSGLFYRTYEAEMAGRPVDFMRVASSFMEGKTYKLDSGRNTLEAKMRSIANNYYQDYERWKAAHMI